MTAEQSTLFTDEVSIEESRKQRRLEWRRKYYRDNLSKNPLYIDSNRKRASEYHIENRSIVLERKKVRYQENKEVYKEKAKRWQDANLDKVKQYKAKYRNSHKEELNEKRREYDASHADDKSIRGKKWRKNNPDKHALKERRRRARKKEAGGSHTIDDINRLKVIQNEKCAVCKSKLGKSYHVDHIMPLALGGSNDASNLQLLCPPCNLSKHSKHPVDFMQERGFLL